MIEILNARTAKPLPEDAIYIGRANPRFGRGSPLGNPFRVSSTLSQEEAVTKYRVWLNEHWRQPGPVREELLRLIDLYRRDGRLQLICWCAPEACHGDVVAEFIQQQVSEMP